MTRLKPGANPALLLLLFAVGASVALVLSVFAAGAMLGIVAISSPRAGVIATSVLLSLAFVALSRQLLRAEGVTLAVLGLQPNRMRLRQLGSGFAIGSVLYLAVAGAQSVAIGARWDFLGIAGLRAATVGLAITLVLALVEELLFRGVGLRYLRALYGDRGAILLSALLFGGYHLLQSDAWAMGAAFTFFMPVLGGVLFGWAAVRSRGLALPLGLHAGGNWVQASLAGFDTAVETRTASMVQTVWRIPISVVDARSLTTPDLLPRLPYMVALSLAAICVWWLLCERRHPLRTT